MAGLKGVYKAKKKNGVLYYRSSVTFRNKHISLGSFSTEEEAHQSYLLAVRILKDPEILIEDYTDPCPLSFEKWVVLVNFRTNGFYFSSPIFLRKHYFIYYLARNHELYFDADDLFYYSNHPIHIRQGYYFVNDYGLQTNILNRYGIKNHAVLGKDFLFIDGNDRNYRYDNIQVLNPYYGVVIEHKNNRTLYKARLNLNGYYVIGRYQGLDQAAVAYNKAVDFVHQQGISSKNFPSNYIESMTSETYKEVYNSIVLGDNLKDLKSS